MSDKTSVDALKIKFLSTAIDNFRNNATDYRIEKSALSLVGSEPDNDVLKQSLRHPLKIADIRAMTEDGNKTLSTRKKSTLKRALRDKNLYKFYGQNFTDLVIAARRHCENTRGIARQDFLNKVPVSTNPQSYAPQG